MMSSSVILALAMSQVLPAASQNCVGFQLSEKAPLESAHTYEKVVTHEDQTTSRLMRISYDVDGGSDDVVAVDGARFLQSIPDAAQCAATCTSTVALFQDEQQETGKSTNLLMPLDQSAYLPPNYKRNDTVKPLICGRAYGFCGATVPVYRYYRIDSHGVYHAYSFTTDAKFEGYMQEAMPICYAWPQVPPTAVGESRVVRELTSFCGTELLPAISPILLTDLSIFFNFQSGTNSDHFYTTRPNTSSELAGYTQTGILGKVLTFKEPTCSCLVGLRQLYDNQPGPFHRIDHKLAPTTETNRPYEQYYPTGEQIYCAKRLGECGATLPLWKYFQYYDVDTVYATDSAQPPFSYLYPQTPICYIWSPSFGGTPSSPETTTSASDTTLPGNTPATGETPFAGSTAGTAQPTSTGGADSTTTLVPSVSVWSLDDTTPAVMTATVSPPPISNNLPWPFSGSSGASNSSSGPGNKVNSWWNNTVNFFNTSTGDVSGFLNNTQNFFNNTGDGINTFLNSTGNVIQNLNGTQVNNFINGTGEFVGGLINSTSGAINAINTTQVGNFINSTGNAVGGFLNATGGVFNSSDVGGFVNRTGDSLGGFINSTGNFINSVNTTQINDVVNRTGGSLNGLIDSAGNVVNSINATAINQFINSTGGSVGGLVDSASNAFNTSQFSNFSNTTGNVVNNLENSSAAVWNNASNLFNNASSSVGNVVDTAGSKLNGLWNNASNVASNVDTSAIGNVVDSAGKSINGVGDSVANFAGDLGVNTSGASGLVDGAGNMFDGAKETFGGASSDVTNFFSSSLNSPAHPSPALSIAEVAAQKAAPPPPAA